MLICEFTTFRAQPMQYQGAMMTGTVQKTNIATMFHIVAQIIRYAVDIIDWKVKKVLDTLQIVGLAFLDMRRKYCQLGSQQMFAQKLSLLKKRMVRLNSHLKIKYYLKKKYLKRNSKIKFIKNYLLT